MFKTYLFFFILFLCGHTTVLSAELSLTNFIDIYKKSTDTFVTDGMYYEFEDENKNNGKRQYYFSDELLYKNLLHAHYDDEHYKNYNECVVAGVHRYFAILHAMSDSPVLLSRVDIPQDIIGELLSKELALAFTGCVAVNKTDEYSFFSILEILKLLQNVSVKQENNENEKRIVCTGNYLDLSLSLYLDSNHGNSISILSFDIKNAKPGNTRSFLYQVKRYKDYQGIYVPDIIETTTYLQPGKRSITPQTEVTFSAEPIKINYRLLSCGKENIPDTIGENAFKKTQNTIPNYASVTMEDAPQIKHVWLDGKIVPLTDELVLRQARGHGFTPGVREPRFWLMAAGILMILFALGAKIREYRRKGNE